VARPSCAAMEAPLTPPVLPVCTPWQQARTASTSPSHWTDLAPLTSWCCTRLCWRGMATLLLPSTTSHLIQQACWPPTWRNSQVVLSRVAAARWPQLVALRPAASDQRRVATRLLAPTPAAQQRLARFRTHALAPFATTDAMALLPTPHTRWGWHMCTPRAAASIKGRFMSAPHLQAAGSCCRWAGAETKTILCSPISWLANEKCLCTHDTAPSASSGGGGAPERRWQHLRRA
jgi:hypothetical protein